MRITLLLHISLAASTALPNSYGRTCKDLMAREARLPPLLLTDSLRPLADGAQSLDAPSYGGRASEDDALRVVSLSPAHRPTLTVFIPRDASIGGSRTSARLKAGANRQPRSGRQTNWRRYSVFHERVAPVLGSVHHRQGRTQGEGTRARAPPIPGKK